MSAFDRLSFDYSYTGFQEAQGANVFAGTQIDNDLNNIKLSYNATLDLLDTIFRSDGVLANGIIEQRNLGASVSVGVNPARPWATATAYAVNDTVSTDNSIYVCLVAHTSGTFATDLAAAKWGLIVEFNAETSIPDGAITTAKLAANAVTTAKITDANVTTAKIADGSVTAPKLAATIGTVPIGASMTFEGVVAPAQWAFTNGLAISRVTFALALAVMAPTFVCDVTNASNVIVAASDISALGLEGANVEGAGIPPGTTVLSMAGTSITLSASATLTTNDASVQFFPHGNGDGSTTFNLPDDRDRMTVGRGNMGGTAAARIDQADWPSNKLGQSGGAAKHTLTAAQMATHTHSGSTGSAGAHTHSTTVPLGDNNADTSGPPAGSNGVPTVGSYTGVVVQSAGSHTHTVTIGNAGSDAAHNNMPPFRVSNRIVFLGA